jgi:hypothetical protein
LSTNNESALPILLEIHSAEGSMVRASCVTVPAAQTGP